MPSASSTCASCRPRSRGRGSPSSLCRRSRILDLGRYFETPVQLGVRRRAADSAARITDGALEEVLGGGVKVRSDHFFDTALGAGVLAVDARNKPVLLRYQATNTAGPVFFSALQLLTYTALTDEAHRQSLLGHLLSWTPSVTAEAREIALQQSSPPKAEAVGEGVLVPVALLLAARRPADSGAPAISSQGAPWCGPERERRRSSPRGVHASGARGLRRVGTERSRGSRPVSRAARDAPVPA